MHPHVQLESMEDGGPPVEMIEGEAEAEATPATPPRDHPHQQDRPPLPPPPAAPPGITRAARAPEQPQVPLQHSSHPRGTQGRVPDEWSVVVQAASPRRIGDSTSQAQAQTGGGQPHISGARMQGFGTGISAGPGAAAGLLRRLKRWLQSTSACLVLLGVLQVGLAPRGRRTGLC
jgi:hypothetical protein